jgi:hypothetical protein
VAQGICVEGPLLATAAALSERLRVCPFLPIFATSEVPGFPQARIALPSAAALARLAGDNIGIVAEGMLEPIYLREPHITQPKTR